MVVCKNRQSSPQLIPPLQSLSIASNPPVQTGTPTFVSVWFFNLMSFENSTVILCLFENSSVIAPLKATCASESLMIYSTIYLYVYVGGELS